MNSWGDVQKESRADFFPLTGKCSRIVSRWPDGHVLSVIVFIVFLLTAVSIRHSAAQVPIPFGQTIVSSIEASGEQDVYSFEANAGDVVLVRMSTDTGLDPAIQLDDPDGFYISECDDVGPGTVEMYTERLPADGTYTVTASDHGYTETGDYWLFVQRLNNPGMATQIDFGETLSASITCAYEVDAYSFDALAGDEVQVRISTDTGLDLAIYLYGPDGACIDGVSVTGPDTAEIENNGLGVTGTYTVLALNFSSGKETGRYTLSLDLKAGDAGSLTVSPSEGLHASGLIGGPFTPLDVTYTLENKGNHPVEWTLTKTRDWLDISSESGTVGAGATYTVTVSLKTEDVNGFPVGIYADTLTFTNVTEANRRFIRSVSLKVDPIEGILEVTPADDFSPAGPPGGPFQPSSMTYTLENIGEKSMNWRATKTAFWLSLPIDHGALAAGESAGVTVSAH